MMSMMLRTILTLLFWCSGPLLADTVPIDPIAAVRISQAAIGRTVSDYRFIDSENHSLQLGSLRGKPVILNFVYTSCAFVCPTLTTRLKQVSGLATETLGGDAFSLLTIGFDSDHDTPSRMREFALARRIDAKNWHFVTADTATIKALARDVGFQFAPVAGGFDHLAQLTVLDSRTRVYAQVYGPEFEAPSLIDPLKRLALGIPVTERPLADLLRKARLLCTTFDPKTGRYTFDYSLILEIAIGLSLLLGVAGILFRSWRAR